MIYQFYDFMPLINLSGLKFLLFFPSEAQSLVLAGLLIHRDTFIHSFTGHLGRVYCAPS